MKINRLTSLSILWAGVFALVISGCSKDEDNSTPPASTPAPAPTANFTIVGGNCDAPCAVTFTNTSTNAVSYSWDFGDGTTSTEMSPSHTYGAGGTYSVGLLATNSDGATNLATKTVTINSPTVQTKTEKLCDNGSWKLIGAGTNIGYHWPNGSLTNGQTDWFAAYVNACEKDNTISFNKNTGKTDISGGNNDTNPDGNACETQYASGNYPVWYQWIGFPGDQDEWTFTNLTGDETGLEFGWNIDGSGPDEWNLVNLSATELKVSQSGTFDGTNLTLTLTFGH